jgi:hypothetical protein
VTKREPRWIRKKLASSDHKSRMYWGYDSWIEEYYGWRRFNFLMDLKALHISNDELDEFRALLEGELRSPEAFQEDYEADREMLEMTLKREWFSIKHLIRPVFNSVSTKFISQYRRPRYWTKMIEFVNSDYVFMREQQSLYEMHIRGEYNWVIRQTDVYPSFRYKIDVQQTLWYRNAKQRYYDENPETHEFYYSMLFLGHPFARQKLRFKDYLFFFIRLYNKHNRVILWNELRIYKLPPGEIIRRTLAQRWYIRLPLTLEFYPLMCLFGYYMWQRHYRTIFVSFYHPGVVTLRNVAFLILALDWFLRQRDIGDSDWDAHPEQSEPIDYALDEQFQPVDQPYSLSWGFHDDEIGVREFGDMKQNQARYALFEPELTWQSDGLENQRHYDFIDATGTHKMNKQARWWQQWFGQTWWWWGANRQQLPRELWRPLLTVRFLTTPQWGVKLRFWSWHNYGVLLDELEKLFGAHLHVRQIQPMAPDSFEYIEKSFWEAFRRQLRANPFFIFTNIWQYNVTKVRIRWSIWRHFFSTLVYRIRK